MRINEELLVSQASLVRLIELVTNTSNSITDDTHKIVSLFLTGWQSKFYQIYYRPFDTELSFTQHT